MAQRPINHRQHRARRHRHPESGPSLATPSRSAGAAVEVEAGPAVGWQGVLMVSIPFP